MGEGRRRRRKAVGIQAEEERKVGETFFGSGTDGRLSNGQENFVRRVIARLQKKGCLPNLKCISDPML